MISCTTSCRRVLVAVLNERGSPADVIGLSSNNLVPFSPNVVLSTRIFSANPVPKKRMFSVPAIYVLGPLHVGSPRSAIWFFDEETDPLALQGHQAARKSR